MNVFAELDLYMNRGMLLHAEVKCTPLRENSPVSAQKSACFEVFDRGVCIAKKARNAVFSGLFRGVHLYLRKGSTHEKRL